MRKLFYYLLIMVIFTTACVKVADTATINEKGQTDKTERPIDAENDYQELLWRFTPNIRIWRLDNLINKVDKDWRYEIVNYDGDTIASGVTDWYAPIITDVGSDILSLRVAYGSNARDIQYFDSQRNRISQKFFLMSLYAEYIGDDYSSDTSCAVVAYPHYISRDKTVILVRSIFDDSLYIEINEGFMSVLGGVNNMQFLRENELYIDYDVETEDGEFINKRAIAIFDSEGYKFKEIFIRK